MSIATRASIFTIAVLMLNSGCAGKRLGEPIVDLRGSDPVLYQQDLGECRKYADEVAVGAKIGTGVAAGAVLGGAIGAAVGDSTTAARGAGAGAIHGGARGGYQGLRDRSQVVKRCLSQRGYSVLN